MIEALSRFFIIVLSAIVTENVVFSRGLSTSQSLILMRGRRRILLFCGGVTLVTTVAGVFTWLVNTIIRPSAPSIQLRSIPFLLVICLVYLAICIVLRHKAPEEYEQIKETLLLAAFNSAVFGSLLLAGVQNYTLLNTIGYGLGTGIGLSLAMLLVYVGQRNLSLSNVPRAFAGLPIMLVYIGIISLAIYGLVGHQLPY